MIEPGAVLLDRFEVRGEIGRGGLARVYEAFDRQLEEVVAIKILHEHLADQALVRERFRREVMVARRLQHPGIVRVHELYEDGPRLFFSMERCEGSDLKQWQAEHPQPGRERRLQLMEAIADALAFAHEAGVVHRDVKPHNVFCLPDGSSKVLDFGLARVESLVGLTASSVVLGTPEYLAPESLGSLPVDGRADLYSLGVIWFELATGRLPFGRASHMELLRRVVEEDGPAPSGDDVDEAEAAAVRRLLRRDPDQRFASARELLAALRSPDPTTEPEPLVACRVCGAEQEPGAGLCWTCGGWLHGRVDGDRILVLTRSRADRELLPARLRRFGTRPRADVDTKQALARSPTALLCDLPDEVAGLLQRDLLEAGFTTEVRERREVGLDLMGGGAMAGSIFALGILAGWATLCAAGAWLAGTAGLVIALACGPPLTWALVRRGWWFVLPAFELPSHDRPAAEGLGDRYRAFLERVRTASLRQLGAQVARRSARLGRLLGELELPASARSSLKRLLDETAAEALSAVEELEPVDAWLADADPRQLHDAYDRACRLAGGEEAPEVEPHRRALEQLERVGREREARVLRVLGLAASLESLRGELARAALGADALERSTERLRHEATALSGAQRELRLLLGGGGGA